MPKETVQYPRTDAGANATEISVHWGRDSHVQLQVERHQFHVKSCGCNCNPCIHGYGGWDGETDKDGHLPPVTDDSPAPQPPVDDQGGCGDTTVDSWGIPCNHGVQVFTDVLTRGEINNMIRVLRRARDQAYGRDE